jgi:hypothetical protein
MYVLSMAVQCRYDATRALVFLFARGGGFNGLPNSPLGLFVESKSWVYKLNGMSGALAGIDKTQFDVAWSGGASYKLPF